MSMTLLAGTFFELVVFLSTLISLSQATELLDAGEHGFVILLLIVSRLVYWVAPWWAEDVDAATAAFVPG